MLLNSTEVDQPPHDPIRYLSVTRHTTTQQGWTSRPTTSALSARGRNTTHEPARAAARDAQTLHVLVYTMVDKEREEAEAGM